MNKQSISNFILPKLRYGVSSVIATSVDYLVFFLFVHFTSTQFVTVAQIFSYSCGLLTNFFFQKMFVFELKRSLVTTFKLSVSFSLIGLGLSTLLIYLITKIPFFSEQLLYAKILITGTIFLYNFYTKRFAFEKKTILSSSEQTQGRDSD